MKPKNLDKIQKSFTTQSQNHVVYSKGAYDDTVRCLNLTKDDYVLDAAAGTCAFGRAAAPFVKTVICLDATPDMLSAGKEEAEKSEITNMQFINGYVDAIPFDDLYFDIVLTGVAFHHFPEIEKPFAEMHRVLKRGGQFVIKDMEAAEEALRVIVKRNFSITVNIYKTDIKDGRKTRLVERLKPFRRVGRVLSL